ncbi:MAG: helix-turn-helix domain-containing protein [Cyanobacteria bacterium J06642_2]
MVEKNVLNVIAPRPAFGIAEDVLGCKWMLTILDLLQRGVCRPGTMQRSVDGLTTKVMNERLKKLVSYRLIKRHAYPEVPPRVEYELTARGHKFLQILEAIAELDRELE